MKKPDFIIAGEARCGTTSLYEDLIKHPDILPGRGVDKITYSGGTIYLSQKEPRFFDRNWHRGIDWYFNLFEDIPGKITGDGSTLYFYRALAMKRIRETLPDVKIIIMLRNPIDRLYSHFYHIMKVAPKWETRYPTFEKFLDTAHENDYYIVDKGIYANAMRNCMRLYNDDQIHVIKSEDYFDHTQREFDDVIRFLSLDEFKPTNFSNLRASNFKQAMDPRTRDRLESFYGPHNDQLRELVGFAW
jgi:hypothetical protein